MGWLQLGLFIDRNLPKVVPPATVSRQKKISQPKVTKVVKTAKPKPTGIVLAVGELDDPLEDLFKGVK